MGASRIDKLAALRGVIPGQITVGDILDLAIAELRLSWPMLTRNARATAVVHDVTDGTVREYLYQGVTYYRYITTAVDEHGYPVEDAFYQGFDVGTGVLTILITTRHD